jgi:hypothetical protein
MSIRRNQRISCPYCGKKFEMLLWDVINADLSPDAKEALLAGRLHKADCPICKKAVRVNKDFLYHDMVREFFVYYFPFEAVNDKSLFDSFSIDGNLNLNTSLISEKQIPKYFKKVHYVFDMDELVRYIRFREKLADIKGATRLCTNTE